MTQREAMIQYVITVLTGSPATTWREVADRIAKRYKIAVTVSHVWDAAAPLRKDPALHGVNIAHVKRGVPGESDTGRIFLMTEDVALTRAERKLRLQGSLSIHQEAHTKLSNHVTMLEWDAATSTPSLRRKMTDQIALDKAGLVHLSSLINAIEDELLAA